MKHRNLYPCTVGIEFLKRKISLSKFLEANNADSFGGFPECLYLCRQNKRYVSQMTRNKFILYVALLMVFCQVSGQAWVRVT